jgi:hypothetical protein
VFKRPGKNALDFGPRIRKASVTAIHTTNFSHGVLRWAPADTAAFELSVEKDAPDAPETAIKLLMKRKTEIEKANHASTFKAGADRELAAIEELLKTLSAAVPQAA